MINRNYTFLKQESQRTYIFPTYNVSYLVRFYSKFNPNNPTKKFHPEYLINDNSYSTKDYIKIEYETSKLNKLSTSIPTSSSSYIYPSTYTIMCTTFYLSLDKSGLQKELPQETGCIFLSYPKESLSIFESTKDSVFRLKNNKRTSLIFQDKLRIPKKVRSYLEYISDEKLIIINKDIDVAKEMILHFVSQFSNTTAHYLKDEKSDLINKSLSSKIMRKNYRNKNKTVYKQIIDILISGNEHGGIIEKVKEYIPGVNNNIYRLTDKFIHLGTEEYNIKTKKVLTLNKRIVKKRIEEIHENVIGNNLLAVYDRVTLPTINEIKDKGVDLVVDKYKRKGKTLIIQGNTNRKDIDTDRFMLLEDHISIFETLAGSGLPIPYIGSEKSGGRVIDAINLMPKWIREMIRIDGKLLKEYDYKALHPNIVSLQYATPQEHKHISHEEVAKYLDIPLNRAKKEHLSFFNKQYWAMKESPLWDYYMDNKPVMIHLLLADRKNQAKDLKIKDIHKVTSMLLFAFEVDLMSEVVKRLNARGVFVLYVFDALLGVENRLIEQTMNEVAKEYGLLTTV